MLENDLCNAPSCLTSYGHSKLFAQKVNAWNFCRLARVLLTKGLAVKNWNTYQRTAVFMAFANCSVTGNPWPLNFSMAKRCRPAFLMCMNLSVAVNAGSTPAFDALKQTHGFWLRTKACSSLGSVGCFSSISARYPFRFLSIVGVQTSPSDLPVPLAMASISLCTAASSAHTREGICSCLHRSFSQSLS